MGSLRHWHRVRASAYSHKKMFEWMHITIFGVGFNNLSVAEFFKLFGVRSRTLFLVPLPKMHMHCHWGEGLLLSINLLINFVYFGRVAPTDARKSKDAALGGGTEIEYFKYVHIRYVVWSVSAVAASNAKSIDCAPSLNCANWNWSATWCLCTL